MPLSIYDEVLDGKGANVGLRLTRLLYLPPAGPDPSQIFSCRMLTVDLDMLQENALTYEALSYTWGTSPFDTPISVNSQPFLVTKSLEQTLRTLQHASAERTLWIDAICINQASNAEKSFQVSMMASIYASAACTLIYLGPDDGDGESALGLLSLLVDAAHAGEHLHKLVDNLAAFGLATENPVVFFMMTSLAISAAASVEYDDAWLPPIITLLARKWWSRAWIRQELVISAEPVLVCGRKTLPWPVFARALTLLRIVVEKAHEYDGSGSGTDPESLAAIFMAVSDEHAWHLVQCRARYVSSIHDLYSITDMLVAQNQSFCQDGRDRIFSIVSLARDLEPDFLAPNYSLETVEVFRKATVALLYSAHWVDDNKDPLRILAWNQAEKSVPGLPSWVPDWTLSADKAEYSSTYQADGGTSLKDLGLSVEDIMLEDETLGDPILALPAILFDTIFDLGLPPSVFEESHLQQAAVQWDDHCRNIFAFECGNHRTESEREALVNNEDLNDIPYDLKDPEKLVSELIRMDRPEGHENLLYDPAMIAGLRSLMGAEEERLYENVVKANEERKGENKEDKEVKRYQNFVDANRVDAFKQARGVCPMVSEKYYLGFVPSNSLPKDRIAVFAGAKMPFVVREEGEWFRLVGACYVKGIMNGEALKDREWEQIPIK